MHYEDMPQEQPRKASAESQYRNSQNRPAQHRAAAAGHPGTPGGPKKRKKKNGRRTGLIVTCVLLALLLVLLVAVVSYVNSLLGHLNRPDPGTTPTLSQEEIDNILNQTDALDPLDTTPIVDASDVTWNTEPADPIGGEHVLNILLIGTDAREWENVKRSDAMILCTLNKDTKTLTMSSFLRDLYVQIPGQKPFRINSSYSIGGMELLDKTLEVNFGVKVDGNIEVDFVSFMELIDLMGGLEMELTAEEAAYLNRRGNWDVQNNAGTWELVEGVNHLTGSQALAYSRIREIGDDFGRTERQRKVLTKLVDMVKDLSMLELNKLLYTMVELVTTDMSDSQITNLVLQVFPLLSELEIKQQRIPVYGHYTNAVIDGNAVLIPDLAAIRKVLAETMAG